MPGRTNGRDPLGWAQLRGCRQWRRRAGVTESPASARSRPRHVAHRRVPLGLRGERGERAAKTGKGTKNGAKNGTKNGKPRKGETSRGKEASSEPGDSVVEPVKGVNL